MNFFKLFGRDKTNNGRIIRNTFYAQMVSITLSHITSLVGVLVDGIIIGRFLGLESMAAYGVVNPVLLIFNLIGAVISSGARYMFTRLIGAGKVKEAQGVFSLSCILSIGISFIAMAVTIPMAAPICSLLGANGNASNLLPKAADYLVGIAVGLPAMNAVRILSGYMSIDSDRNLPVYSMIVLTVSDVVFDLVALSMNMDTLGMGLATSLSYYFSTGVLLLHFLRKNCILKFTIRDIHWKDSLEMVRRGLPMAICRIGNTVRSAFMNHLLAGMAASTAAIAAYNVHRQVDNIFNPLTIGMAETVVLLTGILYGEEDKPMMQKVLFTAVQGTFTITLGVAVLTAIFSPGFASLYIAKDSEAFTYAVSAVISFAIGMPLYGLNKTYEQYIQGIGRNRMAIIMGFLEEAALLMISAKVLSRYVGPYAAWYAFPVTQVIMLVIYGIIIAVGSRRMGIYDQGLWSRVLLLPKEFDSDIDDCLEKSISSMDEVQEMSEAVWEFCEKRGCDRRTTYLMSLSVEEMAGNIITHGFKGDKRPHSIDVRLLIKGKDIILRIRDDCLIFDPVEQLSLYSEEEPSHHMGLRMIIKSARDTQYTCILKLNNLVIKI